MKNEKRVILGEIGFKHEVDLFRNDPDNYENILYYPNEYFNEEDFDKISNLYDKKFKFTGKIDRKSFINTQYVLFQ